MHYYYCCLRFFNLNLRNYCSFHFFHRDDAILFADHRRSIYAFLSGAADARDGCQSIGRLIRALDHLRTVWVCDRAGLRPSLNITILGVERSTGFRLFNVFVRRG